MLGKGALVAASIAVDTNFPSNPQVGRFLFKDRRLFVCVDISTLPVWVPITQEIDVYHHVQSTPALEWSIPHNLGSARVMVQVFDQNNKVINPDEIDCSVKDMVTVRFPIPYVGAAIVQLVKPWVSRNKTLHSPSHLPELIHALSITVWVTILKSLLFRAVTWCSLLLLFTTA